MATNPDRDEFLEDDEQDELARRSIFSAGWFRALLVLTVLAIVVVVSLPYLLNWLEPTPPPPQKAQVKSGAPAATPGQGATPPAASPAPPTLLPAPTASAPPAPAPPPKGEAPKTETAQAPAPAPKMEAPKAEPVPTPAPAAPAPAAPSPAERPLGTAPLPAVPAPAAPAAKAKPAAPAAPAAKAARETQEDAAKTAPKQKAAIAGAAGGGYWVQVGAFLEEKNAEALAKQLRGESFPVQISQVTRGGGAAAPAAPAPAKEAAGQNQLFITGSTPDAVTAALKGKGTGKAVKGGVVVDPPYDLETAMSLSSALKKDGFKVVIRRAKASPAPATTKSGGGATYHIVRVGGYPDRAKAQQARGDLEAKGHPGFLAQGAAR